MTPGERVHTWIDAIVKIWPLLIPLLAGTVWGNSEAVRNFVKGEQLTPVDGIHQPSEGNFEAQVRTSIADIVGELKKQSARDARIEAEIRQIRELVQ